MSDHPDIFSLEGSRVRAVLKASKRLGPSSRFRRPLVLIGLGTAFVVTGWDLQIGRRALVNGQGFGELGRFFRSALSPNLSHETLRLVRSGVATTLAYAIAGTVLSIAGGLFFGVVMTGARKDTQRSSVIGQVVRILSVPIRGVHEVLWALILVNILGLDPLVAVLAITVPFTAVSAKVFSELFSAQPRSPFDALRALGAGQNVAFAYTILPSAARDCISYSFYRFECAIRSAAVLGVVGAGGLGYELLLSFQSTEYHDMWTFIWALIALSAIADFTSAKMRTFRTNADSSTRHRPSDAFLVVIFFAAGLVAALTLHLDLTHLFSGRTRKELGYVTKNFFPPEHSLSYLRTLVPLARETLAISLGSMVVALGIALFGSFLSARSKGQSVARRCVAWTTRFLLLMARSIPAAVWAYLAVIAFFSGPFPAAIALGIYNGGVLGRMLGEVVENLDRRPRNALVAAGAGELTASAYGSLPLAAPSFLTYGLYRWEVAMRETVVVGIAAAGGLGAHIKQLLAGFAWPKIMTSLLVMILLTLFVDMISASMRKQIRSRAGHMT
jgi:phosphonate transport system permease protein